MPQKQGRPAPAGRAPRVKRRNPFAVPLRSLGHKVRPSVHAYDRRASRRAITESAEG